METPAPLEVLLVEDSPTDVLLTEEALSHSGQFRLQSSERLAEGLRLLAEAHFDVVLLDLGLPDSQGLCTLKTLRRRNPHVAIIVLTGKDDEELALRAIHEGAEDYLAKGQAEGVQLRRAIRYAVERKHSEDRMRQSEELWRSAFEHTNVPMVLTDIANRFIRVNAAFTHLLGYTQEEMLKFSMADITHPDDVAESYARRQRILAGEGHFFQIEKRYLHKGGHVLWGRTNVSLVRGVSGEPKYYVGQVQDITERKRVEEWLRLRDRAIEAFVQGVTITDPHQPDNPVVYVNQGFERLTGYTATEILGRNCRFLQGPKTDPAVIEEIRTALREQRRCLVELLNYRKDGTAFWNALSIAPVHDAEGRLTHFVGVQTDITPFKHLEEQYRQAQKMEAIGQLAGRVAHDFNNLLTIISGYSELVMSRFPVGDPTRGLIQEIHQAGERAAMLTRQLLAFSRKAVIESRVLDLNAIVTDAEKMLRRLIGEDITLTTALEPSLRPVKADPGQIEQVIVNLAVNARDAMPTGGRLTIETANVELDESYARLHPEVKPGPYVLLAISDTGCGMSEETKAHIFEPFFTTKGVGKGTGLGLATVFGIIKQSRGHVGVYSELGRGATFKVYLPQVSERVSSGKSVHGLKVAPHGTETVLLVEDEDTVRGITRLALQMHGYTVLEARSGEEALKTCDRHEGPIDLLITDVVMPGMGGREVAGCLKARNPEIKVLYLSGYTDDAVVRHGVLQADAAFLQKPFSPVGLANKVREVLDR